jgi:hypothetical protein
MYYVMQRETESAGKYVYFAEEPSGYDGDSWRTGSLMAPAAEPMTLVAQDERTNKLSDMLLNAADLQVYSPKLVASLTAAGVDNIQYFPITILDAATGKTREDYRVANILGKIACVDLENSNVRYFRGSKDIRSVEEFSLLEDRIKPLAGQKKAPLLFRLGELEFLLIAHESVKDALERDGITGVKFTPTKEFEG